MDRPPTLKILLPNDMKAVAGANETLEKFLQENEADAGLIHSMTLVLEEVVTNVIKYSYSDDRPHEIQIEAILRKDLAILRIQDDGREFNLLSAPPPDLEKPLESRPLGGVGIHLVRSMAEKIDYKRVDDHNLLTLKFPLNRKV